MKLTDILKAKDLLASLPHTVLAWVSTVLLIACMTFGYFSGRNMYRHWKLEKRNQRKNDSIMIYSISRLEQSFETFETGMNHKIDSIGRTLLARDNLNEQKIKSLGRHIQTLEHGNNQIIQELNSIDTNFKLFTSPFIIYYDQKKNCQIPLTSK